MKYERLTERIHGAVVVKNELGYDVSFFGTTINNALNRLAELEDKIEQGTLIELPCKVGDMVYEIAYVTIHCGKCDLRTDYCPNGNFRSGQEVVEREINDMDDYCYLGKDGQVYLSDGVFLTREEAEKRLKELQNG